MKTQIVNPLTRQSFNPCVRGWGISSGADLSAQAHAPRAQPGGCARSQRTCRQIKAREMDNVRIKGTLQRAEELSDGSGGLHFR